MSPKTRNDQREIIIEKKIIFFFSIKINILLNYIFRSHLHKKMQIDSSTNRSILVSVYLTPDNFFKHKLHIPIITIFSYITFENIFIIANFEPQYEFAQNYVLITERIYSYCTQRIAWRTKFTSSAQTILIQCNIRIVCSEVPYRTLAHGCVKR